MRIHVADSDPERAVELQRNLEFLEHEIRASLDKENLVRESTGQNPYDVVLLGPCADQEELSSWFCALRSAQDHLPVILVTGEADGIEEELVNGSVTQLRWPLKFSALSERVGAGGALSGESTSRRSAPIAGIVSQFGRQ